MSAVRTRVSLWPAAAFATVATVCLVAGYAIATGSHMSVYLTAAGILAVVFTVIVARPTVGLYAAAVMLGGWAEAQQDNRLLPGGGYVYAHATRVALLEMVVYLTFTALALRHRLHLPRPLVAAGVLVLIVLTHVHSQSEFHGARPLVLLAVTGCVGYWIASDYGISVVSKALLVAAVAACLTGLFNHFSGTGVADRGHVLSSYDSASIFLVGVGALLLIYANPFPRLPSVAKYVLIGVALLDIGLSLRRGAITGLLLALVLLALRERQHRRKLVVLGLVALGALLLILLVWPSALTGEYHTVTGYFNLSSSDTNILYRQYETSNITENVRHHWLWGIGPSANWQVYNNFGGRYVPLNLGYAHNTYLFLWMRYGILGVAAFVAFLALVVKQLRRRWPIGAALVAGVSVASVTASFVPTTFRWPVLVGLLVGAGLGARRSESASV